MGPGGCSSEPPSVSQVSRGSGRQERFIVSSGRGRSDRTAGAPKHSIVVFLTGAGLARRK